jgi:hypothetical protein
MLAYENQYWWRQNEMLKFNNVTSGALPPGPNDLERASEDLGVQGITFNIRFDF